ncbi:hypothetical protein B6D29_01370 [Microgenomates bacterium UTCPR1]|nr:MAG: hypothetical protein B6D29_01370 [Microgenomates bacterium UTCPR1]
MKKRDYLILFIVLLVALVFRLYKFNTPLADLHSWRQADTAAVSKNFVRFGFDLLHPRYDDLSNVQSGLDNPQGYRMVEFPIYNGLFSFFYQLFPYITIDQWGRLISIFFSLITIAVIYYLLLKEKNRLSATVSALIYAIFPFFVFFSRVVLPESTALGFAMLSVFFLYQPINSKVGKGASFIFYFLSCLSFMIALLIKPTTIFFAALHIGLFFKANGLKLVKKPLIYGFFILSFLPLFLWRSYIKTYPEGIPDSEWLLTMVNSGGGLQRIFFKPAFFRWIFFERINNLILGGFLTSVFLIGTISKQKKSFLYFFLIASLSYLFVFQGGNVQHEYYQTLILPTLAIFSGLGTNLIIENKNLFPRLLSISLIFMVFAFSWFFSFYQVKNYYNYSTDLVREAKIINSLTKPEDKIVTDRMGDTTLLYLSDRRGAPSIFKSPEELKKLGYSYLITSSEDQIKSMKDEYKVIFENDKFTIFGL